MAQGDHVGLEAGRVTDWAFIESLVLRYQRGDREAGSQAIAGMDRLLRWLSARYFARHTSSPDDWLQEARAAAAEAIMDWKPEKSGLKAFVIGCVRRRLDSYVVWHLRQRRNALTVSLDEAPEWDHEPSSIFRSERLGDTAPSAEQTVVEREVLETFWQRADALLSPIERTALRAWLWSHDGSQGSFQDVAEILGVAPKRADNLLYRIKRKLRDARATGTVSIG